MPADRIAYVGDSVIMDVGGARAAGLHPILVDPFDDHPDADFDRIRSLDELLWPSSRDLCRQDVLDGLRR